VSFTPEIVYDADALGRYATGDKIDPVRRVGQLLG
jgi:hypothetical protein